MNEWIRLIDSSTIDAGTAIVRLLVGFLLGAIIGAERQARRREAGLRTFTLICLGSTMSMLVSIWIPQTYPNFLNGDPGRIAAQVLTGIGFLGAGAIIQGKGSVHGLTTAAGVWVVAVIGLAVGAGMFLPAIILTLLTVSVLTLLEHLEKRTCAGGVNKILVVVCSTSEPDIKVFRRILDRQQVYLMSNSYEADYTTDTAVLTCKVNVKARSSHTALFADLRQTGYVAQIKIFD